MKKLMIGSFAALFLTASLSASAQVDPEDQIHFRKAGYSFMSWKALLGILLKCKQPLTASQQLQTQVWARCLAQALKKALATRKPASSLKCLLTVKA